MFVFGFSCQSVAVGGCRGGGLRSADGWLVGDWGEAGDFNKPVALSFPPNVPSITGPQSARLIKRLCQWVRRGREAH